VRASRDGRTLGGLATGAMRGRATWTPVGARHVTRQDDRATGFFTVEPEASGWPAARQGTTAVAYVFDTWLGDDLIRAHPGVLVTTPLKRALERLPEPTGFEMARARVRSSGFYRNHHPGKRLPPFWAIQVHGQAGRDDMGLTGATVLVVSRRVLDVLLAFRVGRAVFAQYAPGMVKSGQTGG
jgi:hypothetical protein